MDTGKKKFVLILNSLVICNIVFGKLQMWKMIHVICFSVKFWVVKIKI